MLLTQKRIFQAIDDGTLRVDPFIPEMVGPNGIDVHLGPWLGQYRAPVLDARAKTRHALETVALPEEGYVLRPGQLYLASTVEDFATPHHVPWFDARKSVGMLGLTVQGAGSCGDIGFAGRWLLTLVATQPTRIYPGMPVGEVMFLVPTDDGPMDIVRWRTNSPVAERLRLNQSGIPEAIVQRVSEMSLLDPASVLR